MRAAAEDVDPENVMFKDNIWAHRALVIRGGVRLSDTQMMYRRTRVLRMYPLYRHTHAQTDSQARVHTSKRGNAKPRFSLPLQTRR